METKFIDMDTSKANDLFKDIFIAQRHRPPYLEDVDLVKLSPFERALLIIDGTVTRYLESQILEPITIVNCCQTKEKLKRDHKWLNMFKGEIVTSRRVLLKGAESSHVHASAASIVALERLKDAVGRPVGRVKEGLGKMLLNGGVEQFRELLWYGKEPPSDLPGEMRSLSSEYCLTRTYRIIVHGKPVIMISEWFELNTILSR